MNEIFQFLQNASIGFIIAAVVVYFAKGFIEKRLEALAKSVEDIRKTSLDVKKELRSEERGELVGYRVAVEKWEYFLQTSLFDFSILDPAKTTIETLYEQDKNTFFEVKIAVVRASI